MVYNTGNGASGKIQWILLLDVEKEESKTRNTLQKLLKQIRQSPQYNSGEKMFMRKRPRTSQPDISASTGTILK